ncbi:NUDIX hydrolase [Emticicia sp. C21]|uniref:NUDIX hydrolase n=1 Tax=Emticicia sp. C21 TaxID=2302915 RepID=UPI000E353238|nr:NUDIX hydrolase [Emticicia sp. C21]RFS13858.1 NUDIX domain-containing protein [Emticicia sp. C21]
MHRKKILELLDAHIYADVFEANMTQVTEDFINAHPNCFDRELLIGHVTGSAWIVDNSGKFVLLTHHRKLDRWLQPGGHCDGDSDVLRVALKEAIEETGVQDIQSVNESIFDVDVHEIPERKGIPAHLHYDIRFLFIADKAIPLVITEESNDLAWVELSKVEELNNEDSVMRMVWKTGQITI